MKYFSPFKSILSLALGIAVVITASYALATGVWNPAPANAPSNNAETLINTGIANQVKQGDLSVGANTSGVFSAYQNASFANQVTLNGMVRGGTPTDVNSTAYIGGKDPLSSILHTVSTVITGGIATTSTVQTDTLKQSNAAAPVCADTTGTLVICSNVTSGTGAGGSTSATNRHYPPEYVQMMGESVEYQGPTMIGTYGPDGSYTPVMGPGIRVAVSDYVPVLNQIEVMVHVTRDDAATNFNRAKDSCPWAVPAAGIDEDYYIFYGQTSSGDVVFPPACFGHLTATITSITPKTMLDGRPVLPTGGNISI